MYGSGASAPHRLHLWPREEPWTGGGRGGPGLTRFVGRSDYLGGEGVRGGSGGERNARDSRCAKAPRGAAVQHPAEKDAFPEVFRWRIRWGSDLAGQCYWGWCP